MRPNATGVAAALAAAERVAASEAPLRVPRGAPPDASESDPKSNYLQAARRAAQYAAQNAQRGDAAPGEAEKPSKLGQRVKAIFVGISVAILIVAALRFAASYLQSAELLRPGAPKLASAPASAPTVVAGANPAAPPSDAPSLVFLPSTQALPPPANAVVPPAATPQPRLPRELAALGGGQPAQLPPPPATIASANNRDVTGSIPPQPRQPVPFAPILTTPAVSPAAPAGSAAQLPAVIGGQALINAAASGDPAAAYEVATRYAEGRGVAQDLHQAAMWYEVAAKGGLAPAMFRLGALYEKGTGVTKDLAQARRYYLAAAERGNANAMHNIGVLYAEGLDGKPDFKSAAEWFTKSASMGISDSQYNLAVLYARGIGVERNLNEAYLWFALAANRGDGEAAKKRDEVAKHIDEKTLAALRQKVESWVARPVQKDAVTVAVPPGGWDQAASAATAAPAPKPKPKPKPSKRTHARGSTTVI
jgi:localization factor PodJL